MSIRRVVWLDPDIWLECDKCDWDSGGLTWAPYAWLEALVHLAARHTWRKR